MSIGAVWRYAAFGAVLVAVGWVLADIRDRTYVLEVDKRTPVYARSSSPYVPNAKANEIIGYLRAGETPEVLGMRWEDRTPLWEVKLPSRQTGFVFFPDVDIAGRGQR